MVLRVRVCMCVIIVETNLYVQMALQEQLDRFKKQQEKCQSTLTSIAAASSRARPVQKHVSAVSSSNVRPPAPAVKFSNDTERLQHINSIRKGPVGAQIKRVIDLLLEVQTQIDLFLMQLSIL